MKAKPALALITLLLTSACGAIDAPSQKDLEELLLQAKVDTDAKKYAEAEKKLLECYENSNKDNHSYTRLAALNQLADVEIELHNPSKAKGYIQEAGRMGEKICAAGSGKPGSDDVRLLRATKAALLRSGDACAEVGTFGSAKTLYTKAQIIEQRLGETPAPADSAEARLIKLNETAKGEKQAIENDTAKFDKNDPRHIARLERTAMRKELIAELGRLRRAIERKPSQELANKILALLPKFGTVYGIRSVEYRAVLSLAFQYSFMHGPRDKALSTLIEDMANFDKIEQAKVENAEPTTLENASFLLTDLSLYANMLMQIGDFKKAGDLARRGIQLAERVHQIDSVEYAICLQAAAREFEQTQQKAEAVPFRRRQIAMLKNLKLTDNDPAYYEAHLELGCDLAFSGQIEEGLRCLDYAIRRIKILHPGSINLAHALTSKGMILRQKGDNAGARQTIESALPIWEKDGNQGLKYDCYRILGKVLREQNSFDEAQKITFKALQLCQSFSTEKQNADLADCYQELALTQEKMGKHDDAIATMKHAIDTERKVRGENSLHLAGKLNLLALWQANKGNIAEAEKLHLRAVSACRKTKETTRSPQVSTLLQLANFYHAHDQPDKAIPYYREVIATGANLKDAEGIHFARMSRIQLAQLLLRKDRAEAVRLKDVALVGATSSNSGNALYDASFHSTLGDLCLNLQDFENGDKQYDQAEKIAAANLPALKDLEIQILTRRRHLYTVTKREKLAQSTAEKLNRLQKLPAGH